MIKSIIKRDGRVVLYDEGKIASAILKAMEAAQEGDASQAAAVANAVNLLNPEMVVFYGFMTELGDFFIDEIKSILRRNTLVIMRDYQVAVSSQMETLMPLGAAAEMFNKFLHTEEYSNIYRLPKESEAEDDDSDETEEW